MNVTSGLEVDLLTLGQFQHQFLDERGHVLVGAYRAFPFLGLEYLGRYFDLHVLFDSYLAAQAIPFLGFSVVDMRLFRIENLSSAFQDLHYTLGAGPSTAARAGNEDPFLGKRAQQFPARGHGQFL